MIVMVGVGGVTRLTNSGLSMVEWEPIAGIIPPLSENDWESEFDNYKSYPEYQKINYNMSIEDFKKIYFWEYTHRILGRIIGIYFLLPFLVLFFRKQLTKKQFYQNLVLILFVAMQGLFGWYMVRSGLVSDPYVSHFRLMIHFLAAMILIGYCYYLYLRVKRDQSIIVNISKMHLNMFSVLLLFQIVYGTFVAGLNAGFAYNTFPLMAGSAFPYHIFSNNSFIENLFLSPYPIQYIHRTLGTLLFLYSLYILFLQFKNREDVSFNSIELQFCSLVVIQFFLGVSTLVWSVPLITALLHQLNTCLIVIKCIELHFYSYNN